MAHSTRTYRIIGASLVAVLMIGGAYAFSGSSPFFGFGQIVGAQSSEELLREYAAKDTDADGLPDWQEALYGTDPNDAESFRPGISDGDAVAQGLVEPRVAVRPEGEATDIDSIPGTLAAPDSLTDRFAQTLLTQYLSNRGENPPTQEEIIGFVESGIATLSSESMSPDRYAASEVSRSGGAGTAALAEYAASIEGAFARNTVSADRNELSYFSDAMKGDGAALGTIRDISGAYASIAAAVMALPVPDEAVQAHLSIANALVHMSEVTGDMGMMETDPLRSLMGIGLYEQYAEALVSGFANLNGVFSARQVSLPEGASGYFILKTARDAAMSQ